MAVKIIQMSWLINKLKKENVFKQLILITWTTEFTRRQNKTRCWTHPVQHMISGPSKEKGSVSSGSDLIL